MLTRGSSKERSSARKVTPPSPSYMNSDQFASYLASLRDTRQIRPAGARPPPSSTTLPRRESDRSGAGRPAVSSPSMASQTSLQNQPSTPAEPKVPASRPSLSGSMASRYSSMSTSTRDYFPDKTIAPLKPGQIVPTATYMERGQRWMEKEEAVSLHQAMDDMQLKNKEQKPSEPATDTVTDPDELRLYTAALDEAAELVWQHQNGVKPPEPHAPYAYKSHLRRDSYAHARAASTGRYGSDIVATGLARDASHPVSADPASSEGRITPEDCRSSLEQSRRVSEDSVGAKTYGSVGRTGKRSSSHRRQSSLKRNISGEVQKPFSGDQIWEEPESLTQEKSEISIQEPVKPEEPLKPNQGNTASVIPKATAEPLSTGVPSSAFKLWSRREILRNPPSQSRNAAYTTNSPFDRRKKQDDVPKKEGIEIRGDDIRQATSMRLQDRSAKLPIPSAVSDSPGRPIVSFDKNWKAPEQGTDSRPEVAIPVLVEFRQNPKGPTPSSVIPTVSITPLVDALPSPPKKTAASPPVPSICVESEDEPSIPAIVVEKNHPPIPRMVLPGDDDFDKNDRNNSAPSIPFIVTPDDDCTAGKSGMPSAAMPRTSARPLPTPTKRGAQSHQVHGWDDQRRSHWSPAPTNTGRITATCHECQLPIEGRVVALGKSQERFHPQCFRCHTCGTRLEALEISPEPDNFRAERLDRIRRREAGEFLEEVPGQTMGEDGDERLRFFCHLDWHEQFAPRCKHCKTSILGEHIIALGEHWHYGHFFCAECGDPFKQGMTHIEKDGYAWCVNCQTRRTERRAPKCCKCKKAVIGQYVQALGGEWHDECFRCASCHGGFDDGQIFPVARGSESIVLCTMCRASELKM
ncbi:paxillin [Microdochium nivale]|nr:paxillin [Microdochium nivale]